MSEHFEKLIAALIFTLVLAGPVSCWATTYYMCNSATTCNAGFNGVTSSGWGTGSTTNPGTKAAPFDSLNTAFPKMSGGDTLIIGSGTYTGTNNMIDNYDTPTPPVGSSSAWTNIQAEIDGGVKFDEGNTAKYDNCNFFLQTHTNEYWQFTGLVWANSVGVNVEIEANYIKFIKCGAYDASGEGMNWAIMDGSQYILLEGCYAWGAGRYKFMVYENYPGDSLTTQYVILRNCVARPDGADLTSGTNPIAGVAIYDSSNCLVQNNVVIDADQSAYWLNPLQLGGCYFVPTTHNSVNNPVFENSICLNSKMNASCLTNTNGNVTNALMQNMLFWNTSDATNIEPSHLSRANSAIYANDTFGDGADGSNQKNWTSAYFEGNNGTGTSIYSSVFTQVTVPSGTPIFADLAAHNYNDYYSNTTTPTLGANETTTNPTLEWPVLSCTNNLPSSWTGISGSTAMCSGGQGNTACTGSGTPYACCTGSGTGFCPSSVGANIVYQYGKTGSLYGDPGYNEIQDGVHDPNSGYATVVMWPWGKTSGTASENEDTIKARMANYTGGADTGGTGITGARGFCATGNDQWGQPITLTRYIWEYMGNQIPASIYSSMPAVTGLHLVQ